MLFTLLLPHRFHRQRILADRDGNAKPGAQLGTHGTHRIEQTGILSGMTGGRHPVGRQANIGQRIDSRCGHIGDRFGHRHASRCRRLDQGQRRPFAHRHGFTTIPLVIRAGDRHICNRHLPGPDHLVACHLSGDRTITNGNKELLAGNGRQAQHPVRHLRQVRRQLQFRLAEGAVVNVAQHLGRFTQQQ